MNLEKKYETKIISSYTLRVLLEAFSAIKVSKRLLSRTLRLLLLSYILLKTIKSFKFTIEYIIVIRILFSIITTR